jgi:hypothetical protein
MIELGPNITVASLAKALKNSFRGNQHTDCRSWVKEREIHGEILVAVVGVEPTTPRICRDDIPD